MARDTKLGQEEITRDIPNVGEEALRNLDEAGMIYIGAEVQPGDILVGKVTPKGESPITPEEKLLRAIFGEKASDVRDSSLKVPPGVSGTVVDVRIFSRRGIEKDERSRAIERFEIDKFSKDRDDEKLIIEKGFYGKLRELLVNQKVIKSDVNLKKGSMITEKNSSELKNNQLLSITVEDEKVQDQIIKLVSHFDTVTANIENKFSDRVDKLQRGDELLPGVMKMALWSSIQMGQVTDDFLSKLWRESKVVQ